MDAHQAGREAAEAWIGDFGADWSHRDVLESLREGMAEPQGTLELELEGPEAACARLGCTAADLLDVVAEYDEGWRQRVSEEIARRKARPVLRIVGA